MPLNRRYTKALESIAESQARIAVAEEKLYAAMLDHFFPNEPQVSKPMPPKRGSTPSSEKQPPRKIGHGRER